MWGAGADPAALAHVRVGPAKVQGLLPHGLGLEPSACDTGSPLAIEVAEEEGTGVLDREVPLRGPGLPGAGISSGGAIVVCGVDLPSRIRLNVGGRMFETTVDTLTQRDPDSMLGAMFSGRHSVHLEPSKVAATVFVDRDGKHFRHILNWLRDGSIPLHNPALYHELLREADYFQLRGLAAQLAQASQISPDEDNTPELSRKEVILALQSKPVRFRGVSLCGENLSKLDLSGVDFSAANLQGTFFSRAHCQSALFREASADRCNFHGAFLKECDFEKASLRDAVLSGANLNSANFQEACLVGASLCGADLRSAHLQGVDLSNANLSQANLEQANLKGAKLSGANLRGANLQRAYLRDVDLSNTVLEGANLFGANLMGATRGQ